MTTIKLGELYKELTDLLTPCMVNRDIRSHYVSLSFGNASEIENRLEFEGPPEVFTGRLITALVATSTELSSDIPICQFLEVIKERSEIEEAKKFESLISKIKDLAPATNKYSASNSKFLLNSLLKINFKEQQKFVESVLESHRVASFLICGEEAAGKAVLLKRLKGLRQLAKTQSEIKIDVSSVGADTARIWKSINKSLGLGRNTSQSETISNISERLEAQDIIFVFDKINLMSAQALKEWITIFWTPLLREARSAQVSYGSDRYLVAFFLDNSINGFEKIGIRRMTVKSPEPIDLSMPLLLPPIEKFTEDLVRDWHRDCYFDLGEKEFTEFTELNIRSILEGAEDGVPDYVYEDICKHCGYSWEGDMVSCLK